MIDVKTFVEEFHSTDLAAFRKEGLGLNITVLNDYEKTLVYKYTQGYHEGLNEALLSGKLSGNRAIFCHYLNQALDKLPNCKSNVVFRGVELNRFEIQQYRDALDNDTSIVELAFSSSSKSHWIADEFSKGSVVFEIIPSHGKLIEELSFHGIKNPRNEKEVLFKSATKFKVLSIETKSNGLTYIIMKEQQQ